MLKEFLDALASKITVPSLHDFKVDPKAENGTLPLVAIPQGYSITSLRKDVLEALPRPLQRKGTVTFGELTSMAAWINRHKSPEASALFADAKIVAGKMPTMRLDAVIDYHDAGEESPSDELPKARDSNFRANYVFPLSEPMQAWLAITHACLQDSMSQKDFAEFLDKRFDDIVDAPMSQDGTSGERKTNITDPVISRLISRGDTLLAGTAAMLQFKRGIALNTNRNAAQEIDPNNGDINLVFERVTTTGTNKLKVPNLFLIAVPVFAFDQRSTLMAVRLRIIPGDGPTSWTLGLHYPERIVENCFRDAVSTVQQTTELPLFYASAPPSGR